MLFINRLPIATAPWRVVCRDTGVVVDNSNRFVALVQTPTEKITVDNTQTLGVDLYGIYIDPQLTEQERQSNLALIVCAPELLAALKEAAYHLDSAGIPLNDKFYELINRASPGLEPLKPITKKDKKKNKKNTG